MESNDGVLWLTSRQALVVGETLVDRGDGLEVPCWNGPCLDRGWVARRSSAQEQPGACASPAGATGAPARTRGARQG